MLQRQEDEPDGNENQRNEFDEKTLFFKKSISRKHGPKNGRGALYGGDDRSTPEKIGKTYKHTSHTRRGGLREEYWFSQKPEGIFFCHPQCHTKEIDKEHEMNDNLFHFHRVEVGNVVFEKRYCCNGVYGGENNQPRPFLFNAVIYEKEHQGCNDNGNADNFIGAHGVAEYNVGRQEKWDGEYS